jgi:hypothetical protein
MPDLQRRGISAITLCDGRERPLSGKSADPQRSGRLPPSPPAAAMNHSHLDGG